MDDLPTFETPPEPVVDVPIKKPRKPMKRSRGRPKGKVKGPRAVKRKRRVARQPKPETHHGGKFPPAVYDLIGALMNLELPLRNFVIEVTKGLSK